MAFVIDPKPQQDVVKEIVCRNSCGARIGYVPLDLLVKSGKDYDGSSYVEKSIICPNCGHKIIVSCS